MGVKAIELLKPGTYTDAKGQKVTFTAADIAGIAASYDPALSEAPLVVGHPKSEDPAYGWVKALKAVGDAGAPVLVAEPHQIDAAFSDLVAAGRFKKVSASLFRPDAPNNPKKGSWYLRHVGFLGAQAPAVKGLKAVQLADSEGGVIELAAWTDSTISRAFRALRDFFIGEFGQEKADRALPPWTVDQLQEDAAVERATDAQRAKDAPAFSDPDARQDGGLTGEAKLRHEARAASDAIKETDVDKQALEAREAAAKAEEKRLADEKAKLEKQSADLAEREAKARRGEDEELLDELVEQGRLAPGHKNGLLDFMAQLEHAETVEFADAGDGNNNTKATPRAWFRSYLEKSPKVVAFGEAAPGGPGAVDLSDGPKIAEAALALQAELRSKGTEIAIDEAVARVVGKQR